MRIMRYSNQSWGKSAPGKTCICVQLRAQAVSPVERRCCLSKLRSFRKQAQVGQLPLCQLCQLKTHDAEECHCLFSRSRYEELCSDGERLLLSVAALQKRSEFDAKYKKLGFTQVTSLSFFTFTDHFLPITYQRTGGCPTCRTLSTIGQSVFCLSMAAGYVGYSAST